VAYKALALGILDTPPDIARERMQNNFEQGGETRIKE